jgi:TPR repeat protein
MAIPEALRSLVQDPAFWSDYLGEEIYFNDYSSLIDPSLETPNDSSYVRSIVFPVTPRYHPRLLLGESLGGFSLKLLDTKENSRTTIAYDSLDGHPYCWGLRWEEVDLFGRCLALQDPEWYHPGLLVLFLNCAAPVTTDWDAALAHPLLESAWKSLGLFCATRTNLLLSHGDRRLSDMRWHFEVPHGWILESRHSLRTIGEDRRFGFSGRALHRFVKEAEVLAHGTVNSEQFVCGRAQIEKLALALAEDADWDKAPALATALEDTGCRQVAVLAALRSGVPAQILWVLELLLGEPQGRLIRRHLGSSTRPLQATHRLEVQFPRVDRQLIREFQQTLFAQGWGSTYSSGGVCAPLPDNQAEEVYDTTLVGDIGGGLEAIRRLFARYGPPPGMAIYSWTERRHLSLVPGTGFAADPRAFSNQAEIAAVTCDTRSSTFDLEVEAVLAKLATRPIWLRNEKGNFLTWIEYSATDDHQVDTQVKHWLQTEQESDAVQHLYEVGNWRSYQSLRELYNQPRQPGPYVVRNGLGGEYSYLASQAGSFTTNVREALGMAHEQAILAVINLTKNQGIRLEGHPILSWEPMRLEDAVVCHDRFARASNHPSSPGDPKDSTAECLGVGHVLDPDPGEWTRIGMAHHTGAKPRGWNHGCPVLYDRVAAARWYRQAAKHGDATAQAALGWCYANGEGVPQDHVGASRWFGLAAAHDGQIHLDWMYEMGCTSDDPVAQARWYRQAAEQGHADAQASLGWCYSDGKGVPQDHREAVRWFRLSAEQGLARAQVNLGYAYELGLGVPQDYGEAFHWYSLGADQGQPYGLSNLGELYQRGLGVERNDAEAVRLFRLAADAGFSGGQYYLGLMYEQGRGVPQDITEALRLYRLAADQYLPEAIEALKRFEQRETNQ